MCSTLSACASRIKDYAINTLGFDACGFAKAAPVSADVAKSYDRWIAEGKNDCMAWAANYRDLRLDPTRLVEGAQTVISLAVNYLPPRLQPAEAPQVARFAYGDDYHEVVRKMAQQLAIYIKEEWGHDSRVCVDSAPILERYWAQQAGLGFVGRNTLLIIPGKGSYHFLCELVTTLPLPADEPLAEDAFCHTCRACERACPGGALRDGVLDARRCLSCQTIENRNAELPEWVGERIGNRVFGCDECQKVCPHNRNAVATAHPSFYGREAVLTLTREKLLCATPEDFAQNFRHSPLRRAKLSGLQRNLRAAEQESQKSKKSPNS